MGRELAKKNRALIPIQAVLSKGTIIVNKYLLE